MNEHLSNTSSHKAGLNAERDQAVLMVLADLLREQKRRRITDTLFRLFYFLGFAFVVFVIIVGSFSSGYEDKVIQADKHTAVVELNGMLNADFEENFDILGALQEAFKNENAAGVILKVNSPGGSPVLADELFTNIKRLRKKYPDKPFHVVAGDVCASGGYYIAVAGDNIYVNPASIVGSIGVIHMGFGMQELMDKVGVVPRIITAGNRKAMLNPFETMSIEDKAHVKKLMDNIHERFIAVVKEGRQDRLKESDDLFSGLFWTGEEAVELGLADGIGSVRSVAKDVIGAEEIVKYKTRHLTFSNIFGMALQEVARSFQQRVSGSTGFSLTTP